MEWSGKERCSRFHVIRDCQNGAGSAEAEDDLEARAVARGCHYSARGKYEREIGKGNMRIGMEN